jgi:hypothetical protein
LKVTPTSGVEAGTTGREQGPQAVAPGEPLKLEERRGIDLTDPLARQREPPADLL